RAVGELTPVTLNCHGVPHLVSVLVSVADPLTPNPLLHPQLGMEPVVGLEPTTDGLQNRCSTTELNWHSCLNHQLDLKISTGVGGVPFSICVPVFGRFSGLEKGPSTYQPNANLELIWTGPGHLKPISYATDQAQSILGRTNSMA